jgi:integral membrane protein
VGNVVARHFGMPASHLRSIAVVEGLSYLGLLFIAMPLKYLGDMPLAVRIAGSAHGALFVWLGLLVLGGLTRRGRSLVWAGKILVASLLPFGTFVIDRGLRAEIESDGRLAADASAVESG